MFRVVAAKSIGFFFNISAFISKKWTTEKVLTLFCTPLKGRYSKADMAFIQSAEEDRIQTDEDDLAYFRWQGNGKRVLFLHGWESNTARWQPYIEKLQRKNLDIYSIDAPGHGATNSNKITILRYAKAIDALVRRIKPEVLVGHSLGGMACAYYLHTYTTDAKELVLLSTPSGLEDMMDRYFNILSLRKDLMPVLNEIFIHRYNIQPTAFSSAKHLYNCGLTGIIVHDQTDDVTPYPESLEIAEAWPNGHHVATKNLGHSLKDESIIQGICDYISNGTQPIFNPTTI